MDIDTLIADAQKVVDGLVAFKSAISVVPEAPVEEVVPQIVEEPAVEAEVVAE